MSPDAAAGADGDLEGVRIGLEVHAYVDTASKLFCPCPNLEPDAAPNANVCPVCTGQPGAKPYEVNRAALRKGLTLAQALGCDLEDRLVVQRKHYFYPDLPMNYQRTSRPFARDGALDGVRIREVHLEEDPGAYDLHHGTVDYDRSGAPLLEIVTEPDLASPAHARAFLDELRLVLSALRVVRPEAGVKADANVSLADGERVEVKNINSARNVEAALDHEVQRHRARRTEGEAVARETRHFDEAKGTTVSLRVKETAADYRFLPDPDLPPAPIPEALVEEAAPPVDPLVFRAEVAEASGLDEDEVGALLQDPGLMDAQRALTTDLPADEVAKFLVRDVRGELRYRSTTLDASPADADGLRELVGALVDEAITPRVATRLLRDWLDGDDLAPMLEAERVADVGEDAAAEVVREVLDEHPDAVADVQEGKDEALNFLMGQAMRKLQGRAPPDEVRAALREALGSGEKA